MTEHTYSHFHPNNPAKQATTRLAISSILTLGFVILEAAAGFLSNSLALLTDAAHNLTDVIALLLSWYAINLTRKPSNSRKTFGYHRVGILVALVNSTTLVLISLGIFYEAYRRFNAPPEVQSSILIGVGLVAFIINGVTAWMVKRGSENDLNMKSAFVHLMGDVFSTIGAVIAGVIIHFTGLNWLDPLVSVLIGILILFNAWGIIQETLDILLESTPRDINIQEMVNEIKQVPGVQDVHDLHVWSITQGLRTMSAHIVTEDTAISHGTAIQHKINEILNRHYHIRHATLQLECTGCESALLYCDIC